MSNSNIVCVRFAWEQMSTLQKSCSTSWLGMIMLLQSLLLWSHVSQTDEGLQEQSYDTVCLYIPLEMRILSSTLTPDARPFVHVLIYAVK